MRTASTNAHDAAAGTTRVSVPFTVPVQVIVNVKTGEVDRVVLIDESVQPDTSDGAYWEDADSYHQLTGEEEIARCALAIALDQDADWPLWDNGW